MRYPRLLTELPSAMDKLEGVQGPQFMLLIHLDNVDFDEYLGRKDE